MISSIGSVLICIGLPTALFDMGMNGSRYAEWAPWGLSLAGVGVILVIWG